MRKLSLLLITSLGLLWSCSSQTNSINSNQATLNGYVIFKSTSQDIIQNFGQPLSISSYYFEMANENGQIYSYDGLDLYLMDNQVEGFEITGNQYNFTENNINIESAATTLSPIFPISYQNKGENEIIISFSDVDYFISIHYSHGVIEKIQLNSL